MGYGYQKRDYEIIDYDLFEMEGFQRPFRGPKHEYNKGQFIICLGAAQTFGCYAEEPFPRLIMKQINTSVLNFGVAGAGPSFFLKRKNFINKINESKLAIVQVMSGRSESNSMFESEGGEMLYVKSKSTKMGAAPAYQDLLNNYNEETISQIITETRDNWTENMIELLNQIKVPKILFWFSIRKPSYEIKFDSVKNLFGDFPQLVDQKMINQITPFADSYVECISNTGLPQKLVSRFTNEPVYIKKRADLKGKTKFFNDYYPTPSMHIDAYLALLPVINSIAPLTLK